ncbi:MAG: D-aminoacyl-tRNA deacylase [Planctomycetia bacterium]|nr:D-aminoacyl-tRNA deacylase [Planctomycetia bacterium]
MRACVQRVSSASVTVEGKITGQIGRGFLVLLGVGTDDTEVDLKKMVDKVTGLRVFDDEAGKMNRSLADVGGSLLVVSQFTLYGNCQRGRRPSFIEAALPEKGREFYETFVAMVRDRGFTVETGIFQAMMDVALVNDGPVTIWLDTAFL